MKGACTYFQHLIRRLHIQPCRYRFDRVEIKSDYANSVLYDAIKRAISIEMFMEPLIWYGEGGLVSRGNWLKVGV